MDHYVDFRLLPDPEFAPFMLMGALFSKLHRALVSLEANDIGVSFPGYGLKPRTLGQTLRLHGAAHRLHELLALDWLTGMHDHVEFDPISGIPLDAHFRVVRRVQPKTNAERLRRRHAKRHQVPLDVARERIPDDVVRPIPLPFVTIRSLSTGQRFSLFIEQSEAQVEPVDGSFSRYGLSTTATIPWF